MMFCNEIPMNHEMQQETFHLINVLSYHGFNRVMHPELLAALTHYTQRVDAFIKKAEKEDKENDQ